MRGPDRRTAEVNGSPNRVLVSGDSATSMMYFSLLLRKMGIEVDSARVGLGAVSALKSCRPSALLLVMDLATSEGLATLKLVRREPYLSRLPVIVVAAEGDDYLRRTCRAMDCKAFLVKPVEVEELHEAVYACLKFRDGRRKFIRTAFQQRVRVAVDGEEDMLPAATLSERGIYLCTDDPPPIGSRVSLTLTLKEGESQGVKGAVIYAKSGREGAGGMGPGYAVRFEDLGPRETFMLQRYVREQLISDFPSEELGPLFAPPKASPNPSPK